MNRFLLPLCLLTAISVQAQTLEPLSRRPSGWRRPQFYLGETRISRVQLGRMLQVENPEAYSEFRKAQNSRALSIALGLPGGALVGYYGLGSLVVGEKPNLAATGIGVALWLSGFLFDFKSESHLERVVALHNQRTGKLRLVPGLTSDGGVGVKLQF
jgi:hypothetical protein